MTSTKNRTARSVSQRTRVVGDKGVELQFVSRETSLPLPPPDMLEGYQKILSTIPERLLAMTEKNQELTSRVADARIRDNLLKIILVFVAFVLSLISLLVLSHWSGHAYWLVFPTMAVPIFPLVYYFLKQKR